jgi:type VI secretion system secreted protein VgrG
MSPRYSQETRAFRVAVGSLEQDALLLDGFSCTSRVSEPFQVSLQLLSENDSVNPADVLREPVLIAMDLPDGSHRFIHGFCNRFAQRGKDEDLTTYEAEVVPWLWFLSLNQDCRIFQEMNVLEIAEAIFGKYGNADYEVRCVETPPQRDYCVQYRESDLDFVSRLLEEEGIFYFFEHSEEGHKLIIADDSSAIQECQGQEVFRIAATATARTDEDVIESLEREHQVFTSTVTLTDYDPLQPSLDLASSASEESYEELYDFPGLFDRLTDGERYALIRLQERTASQQLVRGTGKCRSFRTGFKFELTEHYRADTNQAYFLLSVWESGYNGGYRTREGEAEYSNSFECVPATIDYRPPRKTPKPVIHGSQTAFVVGPSGEEIYTDEHGRVKVQFHWDREGSRDENSSCWIRVSQPWAGKGWGAVTVPRIGQEVIVDFLEGDPDRPIITGRVYNAEAMPPYGLPGHMTMSTIKSNSTPGGSGFNEIRLEDKKGEEQIFVHGEKNLDVRIKADAFEWIGNDRHLVVKKDQIEHVENNRSEVVDADHMEKIGKDRHLKVEGKEAKAVDGSLSLTVKGAVIEVFKATHSEQTTEDYYLKADNVVIEAMTNVTLKVGGSSIAIEAGGIGIKTSGQIKIESGATMDVKASGPLKIESQATADVKSPATTVKGDGVVTIQGGVVKIN